jgi:hypothetical protein
MKQAFIESQTCCIRLASYKNSFNQISNWTYIRISAFVNQIIWLQIQMVRQQLITQKNRQSMKIKYMNLLKLKRTKWNYNFSSFGIRCNTTMLYEWTWTISDAIFSWICSYEPMTRQTNDPFTTNDNSKLQLVIAIDLKYYLTVLEGFVK